MISNGGIIKDKLY